MSHVIWTPSALSDVQRLRRFLAKSPDAAARAVKAIRQGVQVLTLQPAIGRPVAEMDTEFREWLVDFGDSGYVVRYRYNGQSAVLLAVRHQREAGYDRLG
jgi:plasmid stabilization system protein ParE